jgi:hypothetical protein
MIWLVFSLASAMIANPKEEACLLLATKSTTYRGEEIKTFTEKNPSIDVNKLKKKIHEDVFFSCIEKITSEEAEKIKIINMKNLEGFEHLIVFDLNKYLEVVDFTLSQKFREAQKRVISAMTKHGKDNPSKIPSKEDIKKSFEARRKKKSDL